MTNPNSKETFGQRKSCSMSWCGIMIRPLTHTHTHINRVRSYIFWFCGGCVWFHFHVCAPGVVINRLVLILLTVTWDDNEELVPSKLEMVPKLCRE